MAQTTFKDLRHSLGLNGLNDQELFLYLRNSESGAEECFEIGEEQGRGASCIVYQAYIYSGGKRQRPVLLKEFYPASFSNKIRRDHETHALIFDRQNNADYFEDYTREMDCFLRASERQRKAYLTYTKSTDELVEIQGFYSLGDSFYVMMKAAAGCSWDKIHFHKESLYEILETGLSILQELSTYHNDNTLHLDIKPANIYIFNKTRQHVILLDLGSAQILNNDGTLTGQEILSYTEDYAAPELLDTKGREGIDRIDYYSCVTFKSDLYSVAAVLYAKITGLKPSEEGNDIESSLSELFDKEKNNWLKNISPRIIKELSFFFQVMLSRDFDLRYDMEEMKKQLRRIMLHSRTSGLALHERHRAIYPSEHFIGRDKELETLRSFLNQGSKMIVIYGDGGIGKTALAFKLSWDERENYDFYRTTFSENLKYTIMTLQVDPPLSNSKDSIKASPEELYSYNLQCLKGYGPTTVMIIDNFDCTPEEEIEIFHSEEFSDLAGLEMKIIFTSRRRPSNDVSSLNLQEMTLAELMNLMRSIYKYNSDKAVLEKLIIAAKSNTLIVEQIARTLENSWGELTPERLLELFENSTSESLSYSELIYRHIKTLFNLSVLSEYSKEVMARSILFPSGGINAVIFLKCHNEILQDKIRLLELNGWLVKTADNNITVHSLIKEVCSHELQEIDECCSEFLENYYREFLTLSFKEYMLQRFQRLEIASNAALELEDTAGVHSEKAGDLNYQEGLYRPALQFYNSYWGKFLVANSNNPDPRSAMKIMNKVADTEYNMKEYEAAIYHLTSGLSLAEKEIGGDKPDFVPEFFPYYLNLGNIFLEAGDFRNAITFLDVAESMYEKRGEKNYIDEARLYITKARLFVRIRYNEALLYIQQEKAFTRSQVCDMAIIYGNKAMNILEKNKDIANNEAKLLLASLFELFGSISNENALYDRALKYFEQAISIYETLLGKEHPRTAISYYNKARVLIKIQRSDEVISMLLPALETVKSTVGMRHSYVSKICHALACAYHDKGDTVQAMIFCEQAIGINERLFGFPVEFYPELKALYETLKREKANDMNPE